MNDSRTQQTSQAKPGAEIIGANEVRALLPWMSLDTIRRRAKEIDPGVFRTGGGWRRFHRKAVLAYRKERRGE